MLDACPELIPSGTDPIEQRSTIRFFRWVCHRVCRLCRGFVHDDGGWLAADSKRRLYDICRVLMGLGVVAPCSRDEWELGSFRWCLDERLQAEQDEQD